MYSFFHCGRRAGPLHAVCVTRRACTGGVSVAGLPLPKDLLNLYFGGGRGPFFLISRY